MMRQPVKSKRPGKAEIASDRTIPAPYRGWNARDPVSQMAPGFALYLDNWWPTPYDVQLRKGASDWATGLGTTPIKSLAVWNARSGTPSKRLFACADTGAYDVTAGGAIGAASTAITNGQVCSVNMGTTGGSFLFLVNGTDSIRYYDGATWTVTALYPITGGGNLTTAEIININVFKRQLFFIRKNTLEFYYFPIDTIAGTCSRYNLAALFGKGGSLVAMGTWTVDGGQGIDDFACFVTSEGQVAVYQGTDPASSATWALQGVYDLSTPLGRKCFIKFGGDLLYISKDGAYPISKALQSTTASNTVAITDLISNAFSEYAAAYGSNWGWQGAYSFASSLLLFNVPLTESSTSIQLAMNTKTGAWARFTDWNAFCFELMDNQLYMGMAGKVAKAWSGLNDFGGVISSFAKGAFDYMGPRGARLKKPNLVRPNLLLNGVTSVSVAIDMDYNNGLTYGPAVFSTQVGSLWDGSLWDTATWSDVPSTTLNWVTVSAYPGSCAAVRLRVIGKDATVSWTATDLVFERGAVRG